jgi:hypothetical protein
LKRNADALADLNVLRRDYPNTAIKEQVLDTLAVTATETGHAADAIDALNSYSGTISKPALLLDRAHAYQSAGQTVRAAKDYQAIYWAHPLSDEAKAAGVALPILQKTLRNEFPYATAGCRNNARKPWPTLTNGARRPESRKLVGMCAGSCKSGAAASAPSPGACKVQLKLPDASSLGHA